MGQRRPGSGGALGAGPLPACSRGARGRGREARLTLRAGISTLSPRLTEPERMVPVITVPWPLMEKQWSTDMRKGPEGSLVGMEIWDVRSWKDRLVPHPGRWGAGGEGGDLPPSWRPPGSPF